MLSLFFSLVKRGWRKDEHKWIQRCTSSGMMIITQQEISWTFSDVDQNLSKGADEKPKINSQVGLRFPQYLCWKFQLSTSQIQSPVLLISQKTRGRNLDSFLHLTFTHFSHFSYSMPHLHILAIQFSSWHLIIHSLSLSHLQDLTQGLNI